MYNCKCLNCIQPKYSFKCLPYLYCLPSWEYVAASFLYSRQSRCYLALVSSSYQLYSCKIYSKKKRGPRTALRALSIVDLQLGPIRPALLVLKTMLSSACFRKSQQRGMQHHKTGSLFNAFSHTILAGKSQPKKR